MGGLVANPIVAATLARPSSGLDVAVGLVTLDQADATGTLVRTVHQDQLSDWLTRPSKAGWAIFGGRTLEPQPALTYRLPQDLLSQMKWQPAVTAALAAGLDALQSWKYGCLAPAWSQAEGEARLYICATAQTPGDLDAAVEAWRTRVAPFSARIVQALYCPDGTWTGWHTWAEQRRPVKQRLVAAAANLARAWLDYYARDNAPSNRDHSINRLLLGRIYALALTGLLQAKVRWSDDQEEELERATQIWLDTCIDARYAWLFQRDGRDWWGGAPGTLMASHGLSYREARREYEVTGLTDAVCNLYIGLEKAAMQLDHGQILHSQIEQTIIAWYLPRYDIVKARELRRTLDRATVDSLGPRFRRKLLGVQRMLAGVVLGYIATALSEDTWKLLIGLTKPWYLGLGALVVLGAVPALYLLIGIERRTHLEKDFYKRTWAIWWRGQVFACMFAVAVLFICRPILSDAPIEHWWQWVLVPVIHAQLALFIGIFTQLLFDEQPATAPLAGG